MKNLNNKGEIISGNNIDIVYESFMEKFNLLEESKKNRKLKKFKEKEDEKTDKEYDEPKGEDKGSLDKDPK